MRRVFGYLSYHERQRRSRKRWVCCCPLLILIQEGVGSLTRRLWTPLNELSDQVRSDHDSTKMPGTRYVQVLGYGNLWKEKKVSFQRFTASIADGIRNGSRTYSRVGVSNRDQKKTSLVVVASWSCIGVLRLEERFEGKR